jgi:Ser/Thr protein kinase RdoA (MazF antagonist)
MPNGLDTLMATMVGAPVSVPPERAERIARDHYGLEAAAARLTGERDENFKLSCADGSEYVLKIASAAEDPSVTDLPTAALLHMEKADPSFPCPRVLRDRSGRTQVRVEDGAGLTRTARILTWLPGRSLRSSSRSRLQRAACGRAAARLGVALRSSTHPAAGRALIWDLRHLSKSLLLLDDLPDFPQRGAIAEVIARIDARIGPRFEHLRHQVVHNDLNGLNVLVEPANEAVVAGVIDFGDMVDTALIADVAIVAVEQITDGCPLRDSILDLVIAYHETTPLSGPELEMLNSLIAGRIVMDLVIASWHRLNNPSGTHYAPIDPELIRTDVELAREILSLEIRL